MDKIEYVIIGAGIIGLAIARKLAQTGHSVVVLEKNGQVGQESSFRNSAVIHAGIYYPHDSLKAKLCLPGREALYQYCQQHAVTYQKTGKLIVATAANQLEALQQLENQAKQNGVEDITWLSSAQAQALEPNIVCQAALLSPSSGIINGTELLLSLQREVIDYGANIYLDCPLIAGEVVSSGFQLTINHQQNRQTIRCERLINCAGFNAPDVSATLQGVAKSTIPNAYYAKGNYFKYTAAPPISRPIYPLPQQAGLGIHATLDVSGCVRFGPDVEWVDQLDYQVSVERKADFLTAIRCYLPNISGDDLVADFAGIRPKILPADRQPQDFMIQSAKQHQVNGLVALYGIESPGLTASLAIADYVYELLD